MNDSVTVIDIVAQVTDATEPEASTSEKNVSKLEKSIMNLQKQIQSMKGKSKLEVAATLKDMASKGIQGVVKAGKQIAGKVWTVTMKAVDLVTAPFKKVLGLITSPVAQAAAFAGISFGLADTLNTFKDFEAGMSQVAATMGYSVEELNNPASEASQNLATLTDFAKEMGAKTAFSATQAAEALNYMALAGYDAETSMAMLPNVLNLAAAGGIDLAYASDMVTDAQSALGLTLEQTSMMVDQMARTSSKTNTSVAQLGEAFLTVGGTAKNLSGGVTELSTMLGVLADNGVKGSEGGTALRNIILSLSAPTDKAAKTLKSLGVQAFDAQGNMRPLNETFLDLQSALNNLSGEAKTQALDEIFNKTDLKSVEALLGTSADRYNELADAIGNAEGAAQNMADVQLDNLAGSLTLLQSAAEGVKIAIGEKLQPYAKGLVKWVTAHMPDIQNAVGKAVDFITGKIDGVIASVKELTGSPEWKNAGSLWEKIKLAWDKIIVEPFSEWWNGTGKAWLAGIAESVGAGLGTALHDGIMGLLGIDVGGVAADGVSIGKSFASAFAEGFNGKEVGEAIVQAIKDGLKGLFSDAATLLPGGKEASSTSGISAAILGYDTFKTAKTGYNIYKGGKALYNGVKGVGNAIGTATGISDGIQIARAAKDGGAAAQSALAFAQNGAMGGGVKLGAKLAGGASKVGKFASKAAVPLAGILSAVEMGVDAYHGVGKAKEWTGSDSTGAKVASGIGAALGGTGDGIMGKESGWTKAKNIGGGALKGAGIGAAIGSIIPGVGTAIGGAVGAGVGAIGAAIGGSTISKALASAGGAIKGFFTETVPEKFGQVVEGAKGFFTESVPNAINSAKEKVTGFFTETIPQKFDELREGITSFFTESVPNAINSAKEKVTGFFTETIPQKFDELREGITSFFTESVPYAIGYAAGKIQVFFTETVPEKFNELVTGITTFFTETVPNAIATAGAAVGNFFTVTVPEFFGNLWDGVTGFFTETVPNAIATAGAAVGNFFTVTVPEFFGNLWDGVTGFFTETVPAALTTVGEALTTFFTETVPQFFSDVWEGITGFFTETVPQALETVGEALKTFFTESIPGFFSDLWDGIVSFFTESVPNAISSIGESISGFFSRLGEKVSGFFGGIWDKVTGSASAGYNAATAKHAEGGIMTRPHVGLVAEDGAEAIIPLSGKRRKRGIELWEQTGEKLGVQPYANGGIAGEPEPDEPDPNDWNPDGWPDLPDPDGGNGSPSPSGGAGQGMAALPPITIQNLTFEVNVDGAGAQDPQALVETIKENVRGMTDEIAYQLAIAIQQAYANTPTAAW